MELSEAKVKANKFIKAVNQMKDTSNEWHGYDNSELHEIKRFTQTFLKALDNSISKDEVKEKIQELKDEFDLNNSKEIYGNDYYIASEQYAFAEEKLMELLGE